MKSRLLISCVIAHFGLSLAVFLGLHGYAVGMQDSAATAAPPGWLELALHFVLLQPLAHWVLDAVPMAWWTWPGLASLVLLLGANSMLVVALVRVSLEALRGAAPRRSR